LEEDSQEVSHHDLEMPSLAVRAACAADGTRTPPVIAKLAMFGDDNSVKLIPNSAAEVRNPP
jgi:hypothetical protein